MMAETATESRDGEGTAGDGDDAGLPTSAEDRAASPPPVERVNAGMRFMRRVLRGDAGGLLGGAASVMSPLPLTATHSATGGGGGRRRVGARGGGLSGGNGRETSPLGLPPLDAHYAIMDTTGATVLYDAAGPALDMCGGHGLRSDCGDCAARGAPLESASARPLSPRRGGGAAARGTVGRDYEVRRLGEGDSRSPRRGGGGGGGGGNDIGALTNAVVSAIASAADLAGGRGARRRGRRRRSLSPSSSDGYSYSSGSRSYDSAYSSDVSYRRQRFGGRDRGEWRSRTDGAFGRSGRSAGR